MNAVKSSESAQTTISVKGADAEVKEQSDMRVPDELSSSLIELICAAAINRSFCQTLLFNPDRAIASGFNGQSFPVTPQERTILNSIRAGTLQEFVDQLEQMT